MPKISVIMPAYNCADFVQAAIKSIITQTFQDFEFLILDDCSTDETLAVIDEAAKWDRRIRVLRNSSNLGIAHSLNRLVEESGGLYIARMDADDIAFPERFQLQVECLDSGKADLCAGPVVVFGGGRELIWGRASSDSAIKTGLCFSQVLAHATIMGKADLFMRYRYNPRAVPAEDYELWLRMAREARMCNLGRPLVRYRRHFKQISSRERERQSDLIAEIAVRHLEESGHFIADTEKEIHYAIASRRPADSLSQVLAVEKWLQVLKTRLSQGSEMNTVFSEVWYKYCLRSASLGISVFRVFCRSGLQKRGDIRMWQYFTLAVLALFRIDSNSQIYRWLVSLSPRSRVPKQCRV